MARFDRRGLYGLPDHGRPRVFPYEFTDFYRVADSHGDTNLDNKPNLDSYANSNQDADIHCVTDDHTDFNGNAYFFADEHASLRSLRPTNTAGDLLDWIRRHPV